MPQFAGGPLTLMETEFGIIIVRELAIHSYLHFTDIYTGTIKLYNLDGAGGGPSGALSDWEAI